MYPLNLSWPLLLSFRFKLARGPGSFSDWKPTSFCWTMPLSFFPSTPEISFSNACLLVSPFFRFFPLSFPSFPRQRMTDAEPSPFHTRLGIIHPPVSLESYVMKISLPRLGTYPNHSLDPFPRVRIPLPSSPTSPVGLCCQRVTSISSRYSLNCFLNVRHPPFVG